MWRRHLLLPTLLIGLGLSYGACSSTEDNNSAAPPDNNGDVTAPGGDTTTPPPTDPPPTLDPSTCSASPMGAVSTSGGDIIYQNHAVTAAASHLAGDGCVTQLDLAFSISDGCKMALQFSSQDGYWVLSDGSFTGDTNCGDFWTVEAKTYQLQPEQSVGGIMNLPAVAGADDSTSCTTAESAELVGTARFQTENEDGTLADFDISLNGLSLNGSITSTSVPDAVCPKEPRLCQGLECGPDYFGADCGACSEEGFVCNQGTCGPASGCNPAGDSPTAGVVGEHIADQTYTTGEGGTFNLHDACGASAIWMIKVAFW